ncbi:hypothetical protein MFRU_033g01000 [Monilinia fructicola]|uniref:Uncharacterized protein n=1 Tax=Monilinia fructicola TaxID=38448 RepID=A0A5M9KAK2_MONFR|nr:hypothetical protein EYC84_006100 [Monilinia fructicola]KAG4027131.1 hypothetical protein MFRU_033g01000 [Monilinia fructicola]
MANDTYLTDDYVADLLAKDAKVSSIKYSSMGLEAYAKESKPPANKPKPNTRFLRNIIRDTDNHNSALLAKEAAEARARLESLSNGGRQRNIAPVDIRRRQLGDIKAILGGPAKRKREDSGRVAEGNILKSRDADDVDRRNRRKDIDISAELIGHRRRESRRTETKQDDKYFNEDKRSSRDRRNKYQEDDSEEDNKSQRREHRRRRSISEDKEHTEEGRRRRRRERSRSPREYRSKESGYRERDRSPRRRSKRSLSPASEDERKSSHRPHKPSSSRPKKKSEPEQESDSDPLDSIIGPRLASERQPLRIRGRGAASLGTTSIMDSRFHADYDPKTDVQLEDAAEDDWDQALEALRDRQKWQTQGANRLRDAGFSEEEVKKWERGGLGEKREEDVKWRGKGESREWDRGKVVRVDGTVGFETGWNESKEWGDETSKDFGRLK